ncbi:MAG: VanZ family protein [Planctomycetota bacterium]
MNHTVVMLSRPGNSLGKRRLLAWGVFGVSALAVSASQTVAFTVSYFLRQRDLLRLTMLGVAAVFGVLLLDRLLAARTTWKPHTLLPSAIGTTALAYEVLASANPAEALHGVEFFALAVLAHRALLIDTRGLLAYLFTVTVVAAYGLADELIQGTNPLRRFDWADVYLNARVALFSTLTICGLALRPFGEPAPDDE